MYFTLIVIISMQCFVAKKWLDITVKKKKGKKNQSRKYVEGSGKSQQ